MSKRQRGGGGYLYKGKKLYPKKIILVGLLLMFMTLTLALTGSYYAEVIKIRDTLYIVQVLQGKGNAKISGVVTQKEPNQKLVPKNFAVGENETDELELNVKVTWDGMSLLNGITYNVELSVENILINGKKDEHNLVYTEIEVAGEKVEDGSVKFNLGNEEVNVRLLFFLREPENKNVYNLVAGSKVTFGINLIAEQN